MSQAAEGTIVWYREKFERGVVLLDSGRQFMFTKTKDVEDVESRLRVRVLNVNAGPSGIVIAGFPDGRREYAELPPIPVKPVPSTRKRKKRGEPGIPDGQNVLHPQWGQGFVVSSTPKMARVRFMDRDEERSCRIATLQILGGTTTAPTP